MAPSTKGVFVCMLVLAPALIAMATAADAGRKYRGEAAEGHAEISGGRALLHDSADKCKADYVAKLLDVNGLIHCLDLAGLEPAVILKICIDLKIDISLNAILSILGLPIIIG